MNLLVVLTLLGFSSAELNSLIGNKSVTDYAVDLGFKNFANEFNKFKIEHNRRYESLKEEEQRKLNFLRTLQFIEKHNELFKRGDVTHEVGISLFADMTDEEYTQSFSMPSPLKLNVSSVRGYDEDVSVYAALPSSFDWRVKNKVTPVKSQGPCGACWAFTTIALIESGYLIHHNQRLSLSEQQLVDCLNTQCKGFHIDTALRYAQQYGVENGAQYPYQARAFACRNNPSRYHAHITGYRGMGRAAGNNPASDAVIMTALMNSGPIGFMLDSAGNDFAHYRGGVLTTGINQWKATHAMIIVGWGTHNNIPYWIIKNSWGSKWGEGGYLRLARNRNMRGLNEYLYFPTF